MNDVLMLTADELTYLAGQNEYVPGIVPAGAYGSETWAKVELEAENSLVRKGLLKRSFGGRRTPAPELAELLGLCLRYERAAVWQWQKADGEVGTQRCYGKDGTWLSIVDEGELRQLRIVPVQELAHSAQLLPDVESAHPEELRGELRKLHFKKIARLLLRGSSVEATQLLAEYEMPERIRQLLLKGLQQQADCFSLLLAQREPDRVEVKSVSLLTDGTDCVEFYQHIAEDDRTMIGLRPAEHGQYPELKKELAAWLIG